MASADQIDQRNVGRRTDDAAMELQASGSVRSVRGRIDVIDRLHLLPFQAARSTGYAPTHTRTGPTKPSAKAFETPEFPVK